MTMGRGREFNFIFCSDLHIGAASDAEYFMEAVNDWRGLSSAFDFVVVAGDITRDGTMEQLALARQCFKLPGKPWYTIPGNHDVSGDGEEGKRNYRAVFGEGHENSLAVHKGVALLFLDLLNGTNAQVTVSVQTQVWLETALKKLAHDIPILVFSHFPLHPDGPRYAAAGADRIFRLLDSRRVLAYFSGHYHGLWKKKRNNALFYGSTSLSAVKINADGTPGKGWLWARVSEGHVNVTFIEKGAAPIL
jgi:predicted phosphohydrolase